MTWFIPKTGPLAFIFASSFVIHYIKNVFKWGKKWNNSSKKHNSQDVVVLRSITFLLKYQPFLRLHIQTGAARPSRCKSINQICLISQFNAFPLVSSKTPEKITLVIWRSKETTNAAQLTQTWRRSPAQLSWLFLSIARQFWKGFVRSRVASLAFFVPNSSNLAFFESGWH